MKQHYITYTLAAAVILSPLTVTAYSHHNEKAPHARMAEIDTDGNGEVSRAEFMAAAEKRFAKADADGNKVLSREELSAMHKAQLRRRRRGD